MTALALMLAAIQPLWPGKSQPHLEWCEKPAQPNGACVILISGGGYRCTCDRLALTPFESALTSNGVTCVWLWYRTPRPEGRAIYADAWEDGQRAVRLVRAAAKERGFDPEKIGALGCSAGGHLTVLLGAMSQTNAYARVDGTDDVPCHLNFAIPMCPAYLLTDGLVDGRNARGGEGADVTLDPAIAFDAKTCPMCIFHGGADAVSPLGSTRLYRRLRQMKVLAELHLDPDRGHGVPTPDGFERAIEFLRQMEFLPALGPSVPVLSRFPDDSARASCERQEVWPGGKRPPLNPEPTVEMCEPCLEWHLPKELKTKAIQIVYSGGGYQGNATDGAEVLPPRRYLNAKGMTVVTLRYRTPKSPNLPKHVAPWQDLQRTVRIVRSQAKARGLDPDRIGIMGFSAGGHLTMMGATSSRMASYRPVDETDKLPCNVQWAVPIYPAYCLTDGADGPNRQGGNTDDAALVPEFTFDPATPPMLFLHGDWDCFASMASVKAWERLRRMGIQGELHTLAKRGHCFQFEAQPGTASFTYLDRVWDFLTFKKLL